MKIKFKPTIALARSQGAKAREKGSGMSQERGSGISQARAKGSGILSEQHASPQAVTEKSQADHCTEETSQDTSPKEPTEAPTPQQNHTEPRALAVPVLTPGLSTTECSERNQDPAPETTIPPVDDGTGCSEHQQAAATITTQAASQGQPPPSPVEVERASARQRRSKSSSTTASESPNKLCEEGASVSKGGGKSLKRKRASHKTTPTSGGGTEEESPNSKKQRCSSSSLQVRDAPDRSTMTMQELIYYNPTANPMSAKIEELKRKKEDGSRKEDGSGSVLASKSTTPVPVESRGTAGGGIEAEDRKSVV